MQDRYNQKQPDGGEATNLTQISPLALKEEEEDTCQVCKRQDVQDLPMPLPCSVSSSNNPCPHSLLYLAPVLMYMMFARFL